MEPRRGDRASPWFAGRPGISVAPAGLRSNWGWDRGLPPTAIIADPFGVRQKRSV